VSPNAFYEFFQNKSDCFIRIVIEAFDELLEELLNLVNEPTWIDGFRAGDRQGSRPARAYGRRRSATNKLELAFG
jgi:AcrR family transcriptional regulator